ncbi:hypothetical protein AZI87_10765 [Bdellovibrio bacteriovorus]|uniref:DUF502 domain-containing protein n=1 Tax=Bdellovibrio bacteriovorus TaxID=959 RepID=A0A162G5V0_BDEBC|nr:hypothetical protein [Bdellovibrio bacteriovorus]KYG65051.1 hypothetical protein AZI87_10765 [Bdellovibrio bacteriovorus]
MVNRFKDFFKSSLMAAASVILPVLLLIFLFEKILITLERLATPIAQALFPAQFLQTPHAMKLAIILIFVLLSMLLGFIAQTEKGQKVGRWLEEKTLGHFKMYHVMKEFSERLIPSKTNKLFEPALLTRTDEMNALVFIVEYLDDERVVIFVPGVPTAFSGNLYVVPRLDVKILDVPVMDVAKVYSRWGVGYSKIIKTTNTSSRLQGIERSRMN